MSVYILPAILIMLVLFAAVKKVNVYDCFIDGGKEGLKLAYTVFPYLSSIFILIALFRASGLSDTVTSLLAKPLSFIGIPQEVAELLILRPLSGSGSLAILSGILEKYGADSYIGRTAAVIMGSTETVLYIAAIYFSAVKIRKLRGAVIISIVASLFGAITAAWLVRLL